MKTTENIFLTGFMGAGKSSAGRILAQAMGRRFVDMDDELVRILGMPIADFFAQQGEAAFRREETALLKRLAKRRGMVAATGGGAPMSEVNRALMRGRGKIIFLAAGLDDCRRRVGAAGQDARPKWRDEEAVAGLYAQRQPIYADCDIRVDTGGLDPRQVAAAVMRALIPDQVFDAGLDDKHCPVTATFQAPEKLAELAQGRRVALLSDANVAKLHLDRYRQVLQPETEIILRPGEHTKTLAGATKVYDQLIDARMERGDLLVAIGGGMITDLGAFVAATFKRGMDFLLVSTSLLGCVDASVGGKAAVNLPQVKNVVGMFTIPQAVILDLWALSTLPRGQRAEGLAEAYKTGLLGCPELYELISGNMKDLLGGDLPGLAACAHLAAATKAEVVSDDFREKGRRMILNLGHTYGHAVEGWHNYRLSHGRSVAVGMMAAARLSQNRGLISAELADEIVCVCAKLRGKAVKLPGLDQAWPIMLNDKKNIGGKVIFILLEGVGQAKVVNDVTKGELAKALEGLEEA